MQEDLNSIFLLDKEMTNNNNNKKTSCCPAQEAMQQLQRIFITDLSNWTQTKGKKTGLSYNKGIKRSEYFYVSG